MTTSILHGVFTNSNRFLFYFTLRWTDIPPGDLQIQMGRHTCLLFFRVHDGEEMDMGDCKRRGGEKLVAVMAGNSTDKS